MNNDITPLGVVVTIVVALLTWAAQGGLKYGYRILRDGRRKAGLAKAQKDLEFVQAVRRAPSVLIPPMLNSLAGIGVGLAFLITAAVWAIMMDARFSPLPATPVAPLGWSIPLSVPLLMAGYGWGRITSAAALISKYTDVAIRPADLEEKYQRRIARFSK